MLATAEAAGRHVAVNHEFREKPIFKAVAERIGSADAGRAGLLSDLAADGPRSLGRARRLARGDAQPDALRGGRASRGPAALPVRGEADRRLRPPVERAGPVPRGRRDSPGALRVQRRPAGPAHHRPPLSRRDPLRRAARRLRAGVAAGIGGRARPDSRRDEARPEHGDQARARVRRSRLGRAGHEANRAGEGQARCRQARDRGALQADRPGSRRGFRAALERPRGARRAGGDRGRLPLGGDRCSGWRSSGRAVSASA